MFVFFPVHGSHDLYSSPPVCCNSEIICRQLIEEDVEVVMEFILFTFVDL